MFRILTKADIILFITLLAIGFGTLVYGTRAVAGNAYGATSDRMVQITVGNTLYGTYPLDEKQQITVKQDGHTNIVSIEDGTVRMAESTCKNQICVSDGSIEVVSQQIVCLPNRVVVEIIGNNSEREFDAISQ